MTASANNNEVSETSNQAMNQLPLQNLGQQDFLRLMVAQIQNQEPLQQQENGVLSRFTRFGMNDDVAKMQESMKQMANSLQSNQALQASVLVGRKVLVNSNYFKLDNEGTIKIAIEILPDVSDLNAFIYDESGQLIRSMALGKQKPGFFQFIWDGLDQDGRYVVERKYNVVVSATYMSKEIALDTMIFANVDSVSLGQGGEGLKLNVAGVGAVLLDTVRQIAV